MPSQIPHHHVSTMSSPGQTPYNSNSMRIMEDMEIRKSKKGRTITHKEFIFNLAFVILDFVDHFGSICKVMCSFSLLKFFPTDFS